MSPPDDKHQSSDQPEVKEKTPSNDAKDRPISPIVDRASALAHRIAYQNIESRETGRLVQIAQRLDREFMSQRRGGTGEPIGQPTFQTL